MSLYIFLYVKQIDFFLLHKQKQIAVRDKENKSEK